MTRWDIDKAIFEKMLAANPDLSIASENRLPVERPVPKVNKYHARAWYYNGYRFHSKKEAGYCQQLDLLKDAGEISYYLCQVPFRLPGGVRYFVDFLIFMADGSVRFVDAKGHRTKEYILKKKQVEALYPVKIEEV